MKPRRWWTGIALGLLSALLYAIVATTFARTQNNPAALVKTHSGDLEGVVEKGLFVFRGIPYAAPPVADLRWREPQPVAQWQGVRPANSYGNACIQTPGLSLANGGDPGHLSEDCLYLNVWTPTLDASAKLPVVVWIHGGAYLFGAGGMPIYEGSSLAGRGAVFVNLNYRLGQLGFFVHPALEKEAPGGPANFGLLDQIAALKWVQQNIANFGGNPGNVTIMGQSAGAKSVLALFASPLGRRLFHKGIALSSYGLPDVTRAQALKIGLQVSAAAGLGPDASLADLRSIPAEKFSELKGPEFSTAPVPIAGDKVLPQSIQDTFAAGQEAPLPLIVGNTSDDASVVAAFGVDMGEVIRNLGSKGILVRLLYPGVRGNDELGRQAARDLIFTMPARWIADRHSKLAKTWRYYFDYTAVNERAASPHGVPHGAELVYFLDTLNALPGSMAAADRDYARKVSAACLEFARQGKPSPSRGPNWPNHSGTRDETMVFGTTAAVRANFMRTRLNAMIGGLKLLGPLLRHK